jgi:hypothetical protein
MSTRNAILLVSALLGALASGARAERVGRSGRSKVLLDEHGKPKGQGFLRLKALKHMPGLYVGWTQKWTKAARKTLVGSDGEQRGELYTGIRALKRSRVIVATRRRTSSGGAYWEAPHRFIDDQGRTYGIGYWDIKEDRAGHLMGKPRVGREEWHLVNPETGKPMGKGYQRIDLRRNGEMVAYSQEGGLVKLDPETGNELRRLTGR